jgi:hypothetical protein
MTRRPMLCSGTGGPRTAGQRVLTCPVCGKADFSRYPATQQVVPRHFVKPGAAAPAAPQTATAQPATTPDADRSAVSR